ncbi:hypothetical protein PUNSTDRAFT_130488 [Punctularia strigosozonata HHB-11173 SS5]|uniref:uncharacterized protein n=1 Tax=Punctularia strigosozonata (strain HHB-11173) TaxID=741275 RepID=UPI0004417B30|nr:uncharacterized protein PUNSTDRAFT_130488 [Punctularia strigosozonata HHB-11173 SS5]EIN12218.1 hypothetical protein PUNSTDRAFT_130488 [Punctularia strigosozonata HHB-11173 SS5]
MQKPDAKEQEILNAKKIKPSSEVDSARPKPIRGKVARRGKGAKSTAGETAALQTKDGASASSSAGPLAINTAVPCELSDPNGEKAREIPDKDDPTAPPPPSASPSPSQPPPRPEGNDGADSPPPPTRKATAKGKDAANGANKKLPQGQRGAAVDSSAQPLAINTAVPSEPSDPNGEKEREIPDKDDPTASPPPSASPSPSQPPPRPEGNDGADLPPPPTRKVTAKGKDAANGANTKRAQGQRRAAANSSAQTLAIETAVPSEPLDLYGRNAYEIYDDDDLSASPPSSTRPTDYLPPPRMVGNEGNGASYLPYLPTPQTPPPHTYYRPTSPVEHEDFTDDLHDPHQMSTSSFHGSDDYDLDVPTYATDMLDLSYMFPAPELTPEKIAHPLDFQESSPIWRTHNQTLYDPYRGVILEDDKEDDEEQEQYENGDNEREMVPESDDEEETDSELPDEGKENDSEGSEPEEIGEEKELDSDENDEEKNGDEEEDGDKEDGDEEKNEDEEDGDEDDGDRDEEDRDEEKRHHERVQRRDKLLDTGVVGIGSEADGHEDVGREGTLRNQAPHVKRSPRKTARIDYKSLSRGQPPRTKDDTQHPNRQGSKANRSDDEIMESEDSGEDFLPEHEHRSKKKDEMLQEDADALDDRELESEAVPEDDKTPTRKRKSKSRQPGHAKSKLVKGSRPARPMSKMAPAHNEDNPPVDNSDSPVDDIDVPVNDNNRGDTPKQGAASKGKKRAGKSSSKPGRLSQEDEKMIKAEAERIQLWISETATRLEKPFATIANMLGLPGLSLRRAKNPWSVFEAWYAYHAPHKKGEETPADFNKRKSEAYRDLLKDVPESKRDEVMKPYIDWYIDRHRAYLEQLAAKGKTGVEVSRVANEFATLARGYYVSHGYHISGSVIDISPRGRGMIWVGSPEGEELKVIQEPDQLDWLSNQGAMLKCVKLRREGKAAPEIPSQGNSHDFKAAPRNVRADGKIEGLRDYQVRIFTDVFKWKLRRANVALPGTDMEWQGLLNRMYHEKIRFVDFHPNAVWIEKKGSYEYHPKAAGNGRSTREMVAPFMQSPNGAGVKFDIQHWSDQEKALPLEDQGEVPLVLCWVENEDKAIVDGKTIIIHNWVKQMVKYRVASTSAWYQDQGRLNWPAEDADGNEKSAAEPGPSKKRRRLTSRVKETSGETSATQPPVRDAIDRDVQADYEQDWDSMGQPWPGFVDPAGRSYDDDYIYNGAGYSHDVNRYPSETIEDGIYEDTDDVQGAVPYTGEYDDNSSHAEHGTFGPVLDDPQTTGSPDEWQHLPVEPTRPAMSETLAYPGRSRLDNQPPSRKAPQAGSSRGYDHAISHNAGVITARSLGISNAAGTPADAGAADDEGCAWRVKVLFGASRTAADDNRRTQCIQVRLGASRASTSAGAANDERGRRCPEAHRSLTIPQGASDDERSTADDKREAQRVDVQLGATRASTSAGAANDERWAQRIEVRLGTTRASAGTGAADVQKHTAARPSLKVCFDATRTSSSAGAARTSVDAGAADDKRGVQRIEVRLGATRASTSAGASDNERSTATRPPVKVFFDAARASASAGAAHDKRRTTTRASVAASPTDGNGRIWCIEVRIDAS